MAGRAHVDVSERRLKPIYDYLDNKNYRKAVQEADRVLKKQKDLQCAKVLKALALLRQGKHDVSGKLLEEVHHQNPTDDATLQAMTICYGDMHKLELIANMFENAHKAKPDNEELLSALFMAYVRMGNYQKQQQTAMALHKLKPEKNPYYFWALMSIVMQAHSAGEGNKKMMFLKLAERMAQKFISEKKVEAEAEVQMYLIILELQGKYKEALEALKGPLGERMTSEQNFSLSKCADYHLKLEQWAEMNSVHKKLLLDNPDHWTSCEGYVTSLCKLIKSGWTQDEKSEESIDADYTIEKALQFFKDLIAQSETKEHPIRGPYLSQLELLCQLKESNIDDSLCDKPYDLLYQYFSRFGHKYCCFTDMKKFFVLLNEEERQKIIDTIGNKYGLRSEDGTLNTASETKEMQRHLTYLNISRYLGKHLEMDCDAKLALSKELVRRHEAGLPFGVGLLHTDYQPSDNYMLLAVALLHDVYKDKGEDKYLWQAIVQLEKGLKHSPSNFKFKILLIRFYCTLGACDPATDAYETLEIKHIQHDALGYLVSNHVYRLGHFLVACAIFGGMLRFFTLNHKDTTDYLISSYKYGSFSKIHEFVKFRERLQNSIQYATAAVERLMLDLLLETDSHDATEQHFITLEIDPENDKTVYEDLRDNRDYDVVVIPDTPARLLTDELKKQSFEEEKVWLKTRNLTVRMIAAALLLNGPVISTTDEDGATDNSRISYSNGDKSESKSMHETLRDLMEQMKSHLGEIREEYATLHEYPLCGLFRTPISSYLSDSIGDVLLEYLESVLYVYRIHEDSAKNVSEAEEAKLGTLLCSKLENILANYREGIFVKDNEEMKFLPQNLERLVLFAELFSQVTLLVGCCHKLLQPLKGSQARRGKKKREVTNPVEVPVTVTHLGELIGSLDNIADAYQAVLRQSVTDILTSEMDKLTLKCADPDLEGDSILELEVIQKVLKSYNQSAKELFDLMSRKKAYLASLKD
ncbi:N-alpha-acetyltransferase 25, NatB auxiliary subunit-like [Lineus longissimus]|uniref:N-alpha-acetyltransferase 25, NatB auxiliary subunit-like n=1 Tax=Lineus longissimus TaxID=88925 RepID=UPI002B4C4C9F